MVDNGLVYLKEVAKYFMDFLETDFHKRKNPRRTIKLRNDENLILGIKLEKYPKLNDVIRKSIRDSFNSKSLKQIAKGNYTSPIYSNLLDLINHQLKRLDGNVTDELAERIASIIEKSSILYKAEFNQALNTALVDASIAIKEVLVSPFIVNISKSLKDAALGDEGSIFLMEEELVSILLKDIESQITEAIKQIIAGEDINVAAEFQKTIVVDEIRSAISSFFANYQATDVFNEVFEISRNKSILEAQEIYLYFCDITLNSAKYPIFYIPVDFVRQGEVFNVEFDTRVYVNKKAIEFIGQEYRLKTNKVGELTSIKERILYLANFEGDFVQRISEILSELVGFFELNTNIDIADNAMQTAKSQHVQISNACYIALFDKSDEAVVNDYEEILKLLNEKDSELATAFQKIIEDFIHNEPESFIANVEEDWDEFKSWDKLVAESPIPLNEEQRQILMAIKKPKCKYITVEGPPGTGKSHTITAIVCDSVLNNKSVLVLSDKKEALDVVEDKISDALNKVRFDKDFQNPILRLGKTGSTYAQILSTASINRIKTHYRAVKNDSEKLYSGIEKTICSLKEDLETEFLINDEIDLDDIYHCIKLEKEYENNPPPIDLNEFSSIRDSFIELEEFRNIFERINQLIGPNGLADESKFFSTFKVSGSERFRIDILLKIISVSKDIINTSSSIKERFPDMSVLANCEQLSDASYMRVQEFLNSYNSLNSRIFGYLFKGGKVKELNEKFLKVFL